MALRNEYERVKDEIAFGFSLPERTNLKFAAEIKKQAKTALRKGSDTFDSDVPLTAHVKRYMNLRHLKLTLTKTSTSGATPGPYTYSYKVEFIDLD
jgi:hypothetical protein